MANDVNIVVGAETAQMLGQVASAVKSVNSELKGVSTAPVKQEFNEAGKSAEDFSKRAKAALKDIKSDFGKGSLLGQGLKLAAGGGAIAGLSMATREFKEFSEKVRDSVTEMKMGKKTFADMTADFAHGLPVLGSAIQGFQALGDAITGDSAAIAKNNEELQQMQAHQTLVNNLLQQVKDAKKAEADRLRDLQNKNKVLNTPELLRPAVQKQIDHDETARQDQKDLDDKQKAFNKADAIYKQKKNLLSGDINAVEQLKDEDSHTNMLKRVNDNLATSLFGRGLDWITGDKDSPTPIGARIMDANNSMNAHQIDVNEALTQRSAAKAILDAALQNRPEINKLQSQNAALEQNEEAKALMTPGQRKMLDAQQRAIVIQNDHSHNVNFAMPHADYGAPARANDNFNH